MATFNTLLPFFFIIFLLPQLIAATVCGGSYCGGGGPSIRFPFQLEFLQPSYCGYSYDFEVSCDTLQRPLIYLRFSGYFQVDSINYINQTLWINDRNYCMHEHFYNQQFSLYATPFQFTNRLENYTYFTCPREVDSIGPFGLISCLGGNDYNVIAVPLSWLTKNESVPSRCRPAASAFLPVLSSRTYFGGDFSEVKLAWEVPDCSYCEATGRVCGFDVTRSQVVCSATPAVHGVSKAAKKKIAFGVLFSAAVMCIIVYALHVSSRRTDPVVRETNGRVRLQGLVAELSTGGVARGGLDAQTIESYKKTQLGESVELPDPNDKTCSICLGEYKSQEILRTIPECNHYFHAGCIDEWLRKNPTCPLCRNLPQTHDASEVRPHDEPSIC